MKPTNCPLVCSGYRLLVQFQSSIPFLEPLGWSCGVKITLSFIVVKTIIVFYGFFAENLSVLIGNQTFDETLFFVFVFFHVTIECVFGLTQCRGDCFFDTLRKFVFIFHVDFNSESGRSLFCGWFLIGSGVVKEISFLHWNLPWLGCFCVSVFRRASAVFSSL